MKNKLKSFSQTSVALMSVIMFSKLIGMLRDVVLANYYGTSNISDAYLIACSVPTLLFYFIGHSLSTAYLPMYNKIKYDKGEKRAQFYSNNLTTISLILSTVIVAVLVVFPELIVKIFAAGFDSETTAITVKLIRLSAGSLYFMTVVSIFSGYLQSKNNYMMPAMVSVPRNIVVIVSIILSAAFGFEFLGIGLLVAYAAEFVLLLPFVLKKGYKPKIILRVKDQEIKETLNLVLPIIIGVGISQINKVIDKSIASTVVTGGISALSYASIINNAVQEVLVTGIITILFANCAKMVAKNEHEQVKKDLSKTLNVIFLLLMPASIGVILLAEPIVVCFLCRGSFDADSVIKTTGALCGYTIGLPFLAMRDTLIKVFYAYKKTKITTITSVCAIGLKIILNFVLSGPFGINGLAISTSISAIFHCVALYIILRKEIGDFHLKSLIITATKVLVASGVMVVIIIFANEMFIDGLSDILKIVVTGVLGVVSYAIMILVLKVPIVTEVLHKFIKKK